MGGVVPRGVAGTLLMAAGGFCYDRVPGGTWSDDISVLWTVRRAAHAEAWGLALSVAGLMLLTWAWWDLRRQVHADPAGLTRVRFAVAAWAVPLFVAPPLFSGDGWSYVATGALTGRGLSPYLWTPAALPRALRSGVAPHWRTTPSPYGPLFLSWGGSLAHLTRDPWVLLTWYRVMAALALALLLWAVPVLARRAGQDPVDATTLVAASPFVLVHGIGGLHNDMVVAAVVAAAVAVTRDGRWLPGSVLVGVAASVKAPGILGAAGVVLLSLGPAASPLARLRRSIAVGATAAAMVLVAGWVTGLGTGWFDALGVPEHERTYLAVTWVLGASIRSLLEHIGPAGVAAVHHLHPAILAKKVGLVLLVAVGAWVALVRRTGSPARAFSGTGLVLLAAALLSPAGHFWYFLWCLPLLGCVPLCRPAAAALVAGIVTLGLTAPADAALGQMRLMQCSAAAVGLVPIAAWFAVRTRERQRQRSQVP